MSSSSETPITEIPRHEPENPFNYSPLQLATRKKAIRDAKRDYPNLPEMWIEWMYDVVENTPKDEINDVIANKKWECSGEIKQNGGVVECMDILTTNDEK